MWFKVAQNISIDSNVYQNSLSNAIYTLSDKYGNDPSYPYTREDADKDIQRIFKQTQDNMQRLIELIRQAVLSIRWNDSPIVIQVGSPPAESWFGPDFMKPVTDAHILVGGSGFTIFIEDEKIEIDDILDADDDDFFTDPKVRQDYFNLVRQLKNPNRLNSNKLLVLYTARPIQDRKIYEGATQIPSNLFMTNSYSRAEGIAIDLAGSSKIRDIWKVRIEERYLIETLNAGMIKDYQVIGDGMVPIKSIQLISAGE